MVPSAHCATSCGSTGAATAPYADGGDPALVTRMRLRSLSILLLLCLLLLRSLRLLLLFQSLQKIVFYHLPSVT